MTTPTLFAPVASTPNQAKGEPQGVIAQRSAVTIPASTANGVNVALIRFDTGFTLTALALMNGAAGTGATLNVGYLYDGTTGEAPAAFFSGQSVATAGSVVWPTAGGLLTGQSFTATGPGYLTVTTGGTVPTGANALNAIVQFTYNT
jgi:hypothetical protein